MAEPIAPANTDAVIHVIDPSGKLGTMNQSDAQDAIANGGFKLATSGDLQDFAQKKAYGSGLLNSAKAFALGAARTGSFGTSDLALVKSGAMSADEINAYKNLHKPATGFGEATGVLAPLLIPGEAELAAGAATGLEGTSLAAKIANAATAPVRTVAEAGQAVTKAATPMAEKLAGALINPANMPGVHKVLSGAGSMALGSAVEGAAYGLGNTVSEYALGDPATVGEHLAPDMVSNVLGGALVGGAIGGGLGTIIGSAKGIKSKYFTPEIEAAGNKAQLQANASIEGSIPAKEPLKPAQSIQELQDQVLNTDAKYMPSVDLPAKARLSEIQQSPFGQDLPVPINELQLRSLSSPQDRQWYGTLKQSDTEAGRILNNMEAIQKSGAMRDLNKTVESIAPGAKLTADPYAAGNSIVDDFNSQYNAEKQQMGPLFKEFDNAAAASIADRQSIVNSITDSIPGAKEYLTPTAKGMELAPYKATMPFSKAAYGAMKDIVSAANEEGLTIGKLRNLRETIRDGIKWDTAPREARELTSVRKSLMDFIQGKVQEVSPDMEVRGLFKRYAINEAKRADLEEILGASLSDKASLARSVKPENVIDKIFSNSASVDAAKQLLGPKFDEAVANKLKYQIAQASDPTRNGFSSAKFASYLRKDATELSRAMAEKTGTLQRITDATDFMKILPDAPAVNPSGTAPTLSLLRELAGLDIAKPGEALAKVGKQLKSGYENAKQQEVINAVLKGSNIDAAKKAAEDHMAKTTILGQVERLYNKGSNKIESAVSSVFNADANKLQPAIGYISSKLTHKEKADKTEKVLTTLNQLQSNPGTLIEHLDHSTQGLFSIAPQTIGTIHQTTAKAISFLASKAPVVPPAAPLSAKNQLSPTEIAKFDRYQYTVEHPLSVLDNVASGSVMPEQIETLQTVYPSMYNQMKQSMLNQIVARKAKKQSVAHIPYSTKIGLSMFMGYDLDSSLSQPSIAANQAVLSNLTAQNKAADTQMTHGRGIKTTAKGLSNLTVADRLNTNTQELAKREVS